MSAVNLSRFDQAEPLMHIGVDVSKTKDLQRSQTQDLSSLLFNHATDSLISRQLSMQLKAFELSKVRCDALDEPHSHRTM